MFCVYCGIDKTSDEATDEHVIPRAIGGNVHPTNPFLLRDVCMSCNTYAGKFIDAAYIRSWFLSNDRAFHASRYADLARNPMLPLAYSGHVVGFDWSGKSCDLWRGPARTLCYHFHDPYEESEFQPGIVGRPLNVPIRQIDRGFVIVFIRAKNPVWHEHILRAVRNQFDDCPRYLSNVEGGAEGFEPVPDDLRTLDAQLRSFIGNPHNGSFSVGIDFEQRFTAKLALGAGALFLNPGFRRSADAQRLRDFMWEKDPSERAKQGVTHLSSLESQPDSVKKLTAWKAGHVIMFYPLGDTLIFAAAFYGQGLIGIEVSSNAADWPDDIQRAGRLYFVAPGKCAAYGPCSLQEFIMARVDPSGTDPTSTFLRETEQPSVAPPFDPLS